MTDFKLLKLKAFMKCSVLFVFAALALASTSNAFADDFSNESVGKIVQEKQRKALIINYLHKRIASHQKMTAEQIIADLKGSVEARSTTLTHQPAGVADGYRRQTEVAINQLAEIQDKTLLLAFETQQLQSLMTSSGYHNYFFFLTQALTVVCYSPDTMMYQCGEGGGTVDGKFRPDFLMIFTLPIDLILLPFEAIATIAAVSSGT